MGFSQSMDERKIILSVPVDLPLEMESAIAETASVVRLVRRGGN